MSKSRLNASIDFEPPPTTITPATPVNDTSRSNRSILATASPSSSSSSVKKSSTKKASVRPRVVPHVPLTPDAIRTYSSGSLSGSGGGIYGATPIPSGAASTNAEIPIEVYLQHEDEDESRMFNNPWAVTFSRARNGPVLSLALRFLYWLLAVAYLIARALQADYENKDAAPVWSHLILKPLPLLCLFVWV